jgi:hypothetical protein
MLIWLFLIGVHTTHAWNMIPPDEFTRNIADDFNKEWIVEAGRKFDERFTHNSTYFLGYSVLLVLIILLGVLLRIVVKMNHMESTTGRIRSDLLEIYTRLWLISRWGVR